MKFDKTKPVPSTFAEALIGDTSWLPEPDQGEKAVGEKLTEKAVVLESFTRFVEEKIAESPDQQVRFEGGSLALKEKTEEQEFKPQFMSASAWFQDFNKRVGEEIFSQLVETKKNISVLFYVDEFKSETPSEGSSALREFLFCFEKDVAELFEKMVKAMKLKTHEFAISAVNLSGSARELSDLLEEIHFRAPDYVIPLGAQATQAILGNKERLASVHGKFYPLPALKLKPIQVVPLFHPNVISTNQNMKKSTWADMQKIMQAMGLL